MKKILLIATCLAGFATSASATLYTCSLEEQGPRTGWIPPVVMVAVQDDGTLLVSDSIGAAIQERPAEGRKINESDKILAVAWDVGGTLSITNQYARMLYTATIDKNRNTIRMRGKPHGYINVYRGVGRCRVGEIPG
ncbi:MAG: hypothetical protein AAGM21_09820 [Pseudomonadota bacterium]